MSPANEQRRPVAAEPAPSDASTSHLFSLPALLQAASYTMPTCNYEDPLKQLTATDLQEALDWAVTVDTKFCLKVSAARRLLVS